MRANVSVGANHSGCKSLALTNNLSTVMLRPYKIGMLSSSIELYRPLSGNRQFIEPDSITLYKI
jgi:hypothetical protein